MKDEEAIDILKNIIADEVIGTYCIEIQKEVDCSKNCENEDCYLIQAIDTVSNLIEKQKAELEKKDKIIDNLVDNLRYYNGMQQDDIFCNQICSNKENCDKENCYNRIKEYFENKVKESK